MKSIFTIITLLAAGLYLQSCGEKSEAAKIEKSEAIPVKTIPISAVNTQPTISVAGQFTTNDEVNLSFKTGGIIRKIYVDEGDAVRKGQLLAVLDLTEINAQVQQVELNLEKTKRDYDRVNNLYKDSVATLEQLQNTKTAWELAQKQLETAKFNKVYSEIHAVENGYVLSRMMNEGQLVNAGSPVFKTNGAGAGNWLLRVGVSDKEWTMIAPEDSASVSIPAIPGKAITGKVIRKSQGIDPGSGSFTVDIQLENNLPEGIASGMFGKATILASNQSQAQTWAIPYGALLDGDGSTGFVFVSNDQQTAHKLPVVVEGIEKDKVIISSGLENAQFLVIAGSAYLTDNSPIQIFK